MPKRLFLQSRLLAMHDRDGSKHRSSGFARLPAPSGGISPCSYDKKLLETRVGADRVEAGVRAELQGAVH